MRFLAEITLSVSLPFVSNVAMSQSNLFHAYSGNILQRPCQLIFRLKPETFTGWRKLAVKPTGKTFRQGVSFLLTRDIVVFYTIGKPTV